MKNTVTPSRSLAGKVAVITGSDRGIGKATALEFLKAGAQVTINGLTTESVEKTAAEFRELGFEVFHVVGDISKYPYYEDLIQKTKAHYGKVDILINNAGMGFRGLLENTSHQVFDAVIDSNLKSAVHCTLAALEEIKRNKGSIVFISSLSGIRGIPYSGPYCVAKMGLTALAETLRMELHGSGVHIGLLYVGITDYDADKRVIAADGAMIPITRGHHHTREQVARIVLNCVRRRRFKLVLTWLGKLQAFFQRTSPAVLKWVLLRANHSGLYH